MRDIEAMAYPLPEDILVRKLSGDLAGAQALIDIYLREHRAPELEPRLKLEQQVIARLPDNYPYTRAQALDMARAAIPGLDEAGFAELELSADIAYVYIDGQRRYFAEFLPSLLKLRPDVAARAGRAPDANKPLLDEAISLMRARGELGYRLHMRARLQVCDEAFTPGTYRAHLPLPAQAAQQSRLKLLSASPGLVCVADARADARTAYFERRLDANAPFEVEYEFDNRVRYFDADRPMPDMPLYPDVPAPNADDLAELPGHIMFTPYLRALASRIVGDADAPLERAWRIYDYVTGHVRYSYMREYFLLPPIAEYAALGLKGDCGVQALLFITLCRIAGVPARWQSGLYAAPGDVGSHDWAQFYAPGWGWLFADCSFGGAARRAGNAERWKFYFGNLDPYRMVANSRFQAPLRPALQFGRNDPYDNQSGECESETRLLRPNELCKAREVVEAIRLN